MWLFKSKRRALELEKEEEEARKLGDILLQYTRMRCPPGLRLKVTNKNALTDAGRAALTPDDELIIDEWR